MACFPLVGTVAFCSEAPTDKDSFQKCETVNTESDFEKDLRFLHNLGYDTDEMVEDGDYYFLPPDRLISKSNVREMQNTPQTRMTSGLKNFEQEKIDEAYRNIYLDDFNVSQDEMEYLKAAVDEWNKISGSSIRFKIGPAENSVNVYTYSTSDMESKQWLMRVEYPVLKKPGTKIEINTKVPYYFWLPKKQRIYMYMHALGHLVGFAHYGKGYEWIKGT